MTGRRPLPRIADLDWGASESWVVWRMGEAATRAHELAAARTSDAVVRDALVEAIVGLERTAEQDYPGAVGLGVWLPDPTLPLTEAGLVLSVHDPDPGESRRMTIEEAEAEAGAPPPRRRGVETLSVEVARGRVAAEEAVVRVVDYAEQATRQITTVLTWFVFPPGTDQTLVLEFITWPASLFDALSDESNVVIDSLVVTAGAQ